jgi:multiple sugar transport system substrate-binding protein
VKNISDPSSGISRRNALMLFGASVAATALSACAAPGSSGSTTSSGKKVLNYSTSWQPGSDDPRAMAQSQIVEAFMKANPDVQVNVTYVVWDQALTKLGLAVGAKQSPDVSLQMDSNLLTLIDQAALMSMDQYVSGWPTTRKSDYTTPWDDMVFDGHLYAFRESPRPANALFYNKTAFVKAGISGPPKTSDEWASDALHLTSPGKYGVTFPFGNTADLNRFMAAFASMLWARGGDLFDLQTRKPTFDQEPGVYAMQWVQNLVHKYHALPTSSATASADTVDQQFIAEAVATTVGNTGNLTTYTSGRKGDWVTSAPFPNFANDAAKPGAAFTAGGWTQVIPKGANADLAWKLIEFYQTPEADLIKAKVGNELPTRKSVLSDPFFKTRQATDMNGWLAWMAANPHPAPLKIPKYQNMVEAIYGALQAIVTRNADVASTLQQAAQQYVGQLG